MKITHIKGYIDQKTVFRLIDCNEDNPAYEEMLEAYEELLPEMLSLAEGQCLFEFGEIYEEDAVIDYPAGTKVLYVIATVGKALSHLETEFFRCGDYVKGMLTNAMADSFLFSLEDEWLEEVRRFCVAHGVGIKKRLEAPINLPLSVQKNAFEYLHADSELNMRLSSGYMYDPVKSTCQVLVLSDDPKQFQGQHDCRNCPLVECTARRIQPAIITIHDGQNQSQIFCEHGEDILTAYQRQKESVSAVCNHKGKCGKCKIQLISGELKITEEDRSIFNETELREGYRLSCQAIPTTDCMIKLCFLDESEFQAVDQFVSKKDLINVNTLDQKQNVGIAIDIGTTTIVAQLIDLTAGKILSTSSTINHQRRLGADVISRIEAAIKGSGAELQTIIRTDIDTLISTLLATTDLLSTMIEQVVISGNTTMIHLLMGYSCETLGVFPFTPVNINTIKGSYQTIIGSNQLSCKVIVLPGISTFVGGDITSGLYACEFEKSDEINLLVDLGTNGEMAIGCKNKLLVASTAAGPAFEGGNISCGTGSVPGAISRVRIDSDQQIHIKTISDLPPIGICGTGVIEIVSELLNLEIIDETGLLDEKYFKKGFSLTNDEVNDKIIFTQKDIREVQLAKSAVRAGVETLIRRYGVSYNDISHVYLAGGFGFKLDKDAAIKIGLFPEALKEKIIAVGNSSLAGAIRVLGENDWKHQTEYLIAHSLEISLSNDAYFNEFYMTYMMFGDD